MKKSDIYYVLQKSIDPKAVDVNVDRFIQFYLEDKFPQITDFTEAQMEQIYQDIDLINKSYPLAYVTSKAYFYGMSFEVSDAVLIPRPETEELVEWIITDASDRKGLKVLDVGTGSGCIAITLAKHLHSANIEAWDISDSALTIAKSNANQLMQNVDFVLKDVCQVHEYDRKKDIIVSNPPYVRPSELDVSTFYEPKLALKAPEADPLYFYKCIAKFAWEALYPQGLLYFELSEFTAYELKDYLGNMGYEKIIIKNDLQDKARMLRCAKP